MLIDESFPESLFFSTIILETAVADACGSELEDATSKALSIVCTKYKLSKLQTF